MRVLYLTNKPIFPTVDGGCKAMHQFVKCLVHNEYDIEHICFSTHKHKFNKENYPKFLLEKVPTSSFDIETKIQILPAIKSFFTRKSYVLSRFDSSDFHSQLIAKISKNEFTHIIIESLFLTPYIETIRSISDAKIIVRTHNVEFEIWKQLAVNSKNPFKKFYFKRLSEDLKITEIDNLNKADLIATISNEDLIVFDSLGILTPKIVIPIAIDLSENKVDYTNKNLFFIGSMNWKPNVEAVEWLISKILPEIKKTHPQTQLYIAGSYMGNQFPSDKLKGIANFGFVHDSQQFMENHGVLISSIRSGSGVRVKLLEALALGIPVVTTKVGASGMQQNKCVYLAETTVEFVSQITELLDSQEKRMELGSKARKFIKENNSIQSISTYLNDNI
ncbi:MAG: hypothetical protein RI883_933 [Bacteroidota bacterium]|jgi:glycosyltransferase involved in cell wall biosynthesis